MDEKTYTMMINIADNAIPLEVSEGLTGPNGYRQLACKVLDCAQASLRNAAARGDDEGDRLGTLEDSIHGGDILAQLARELFRAADAFEQTPKPQSA